MPDTTVSVPVAANAIDRLTLGMTDAKAPTGTPSYVTAQGQATCMADE